MPLQPLRDLLYVLPIEKDVDPNALIITPETYEVTVKYDDKTSKQLPQYTQKNVNQGIVKYRGPLTTGEIQRGAHVLFPPGEGQELVVEGEGRLVLVREKEIVALITDGDNYLYTEHEVRRLYQRVTEDVARWLETDEEKAIALKIGKNVGERLTSQFFEEMFF